MKAIEHKMGNIIVLLYKATVISTTSAVSLIISKKTVVRLENKQTKRKQQKTHTTTEKGASGIQDRITSTVQDITEARCKPLAVGHIERAGETSLFCTPAAMWLHHYCQLSETRHWKRWVLGLSCTIVTILWHLA